MARDRHLGAPTGRNNHVHGLINCELAVYDPATHRFLGFARSMIRRDGQDPNYAPVDEYIPAAWHNPADGTDDNPPSRRFAPPPAATNLRTISGNFGPDTRARVHFGDWCLPILWEDRNFGLEGRPVYTMRNTRTWPLPWFGADARVDTHDGERGPVRPQLVWPIRSAIGTVRVTVWTGPRR